MSFSDGESLAGAGRSRSRLPAFAALTVAFVLLLLAWRHSGLPGATRWAEGTLAVSFLAYGLFELFRPRYRVRPDRDRTQDELRRAAGELTVDGPVLRYDIGDDGWELHEKEILAVGEKITDSVEDDYHLCFLKKLDGTWLQASFYARGREEALRWLGERLGDDFTMSLASSTAFSSRLLWPAELAGQPLFAARHEPARGLRALGHPGRDTVSISPTALGALRAWTRPTG